MKTLIFAAVFTLALSANAFSQFRDFTQELMQEQCAFQSSGRNRYFVLEPGYQLVLENKRGGRLVITVSDQTRNIGGVETRLVVENESQNGITTEISKNYFAFCRNTGGVFYFGEEVDTFRGGKIAGHEGSWLAEGRNRAGLAMPGEILLGARYYQEQAPSLAMDRAEIISISETKKTPAGIFTNCLKIEESNPLEPGSKEYKFYAPGIGLIQDEDLLLTKYGSVK